MRGVWCRATSSIRACVGQTDDALRRVVLLGRISLYGHGASRLHDEIIAVTARWIDPIARKGPLVPYAEDTEKLTLRGNAGLRDITR
jgi:hypothetical protein